MRNVKFVLEYKKIYIQERNYMWGETSLTEMCNMHCKTKGRCHIHLVTCTTSRKQGSCTIRLNDGSRHETRKY